MVVFGQRGSIRAKVIFYSGKSGFIRTRWLFSGKMVLFEKNGCIGKKMVVFGQKWLYSGKRGCIQAEVVVLGQK